jgi:hypothetical protein
VVKGDDIDLKRQARDFLRLHSGDLADAMGRIHDMIRNGEI